MQRQPIVKKWYNNTVHVPIASDYRLNKSILGHNPVCLHGHQTKCKSIIKWSASRNTRSTGTSKWNMHCMAEPTLSSLSHFSSSCLRPCCSTGRHSSNDSYLLSCPWSSRIPKYASSGDVWPCCAGTCWKRWIVCGVRSIPYGRHYAACINTHCHQQYNIASDSFTSKE